MIEYRTKLNNTFVGIWLGGNKGNVVLGCGLPQYIDKYHPFVAQITSLGYNLFVPRYQGTFESDGYFNIFSSKQTIEDGIELVLAGETIELFGQSEIMWDKNIPLYVIGFSYGSLPVLLSSNEKVRKTILVCPFVDIHFHLGETSGENIKDTFSFLERAYPNLYRLNVDNAIQDLSEITLPDQKENLEIVIGISDVSIPKEEIDMLLNKYPKARFFKENNGHSLKISDELLLKILNS
jgi:hypothetical protein